MQEIASWEDEMLDDMTICDCDACMKYGWHGGCHIVKLWAFGPSKSQTSLFLYWKEYRNNLTDEIDYASVIFSIDCFWIFRIFNLLRRF
jgi:hypothetical protein